MFKPLSVLTFTHEHSCYYFLWIRSQDWTLNSPKFSILLVIFILPALSVTHTDIHFQWYWSRWVGFVIFPWVSGVKSSSAALLRFTGGKQSALENLFKLLYLVYYFIFRIVDKIIQTPKTVVSVIFLAGYISVTPHVRACKIYISVM